MRLNPTHLLTPALIVIVALTLSGCTTPTPPAGSKSRHTEAAPLFATEEEALAAAEEAYAEYVAVSTLIYSEGGERPERMESVATGIFLEASLEGFREARLNGWRSTGVRRFGDMKLQAFYPQQVKGMIVVYVCEDISDVDVLDAEGASIVPDSRPDMTTFQATFDRQNDRLLLSSREAWVNGPC